MTGVAEIAVETAAGVVAKDLVLPETANVQSSARLIVLLGTLASTSDGHN